MIFFYEQKIQTMNFSEAQQPCFDCTCSQRVARELQKTRALLIDQVTTISGRQRSQSYNHTDKENGDMAMILVNRPEDCQLTERNT
jgi:hypothetical protein